MKIFKSIKFKLTIWYSAILIVFYTTFLLLINIGITKFMLDSPSPRPFRPELVTQFQNLNKKEFQLITESRLNDLNNIRTISAYSLIPLVLLSFAGGYFLSDKLLSPINNLNEEISNRNTKNLGQQIEFEDTEDEISSLIKNFNSMSKNISISFNRQKEFVENASHEIKTPLSVAQANIQSILEDDKINKKDLKEALTNTSNSLLFMNKLSEDLLLFSLMEQVTLSEKGSISNLVTDAVNQTSKLAKDTGFKVEIDVKKDFEVDFNDGLLSRAFQNLIENSIKYSKGTNINIVIDSNDKSKFVLFSDNGIGISQKYKEKIFDRFFRIDKSRSRKTGGSGLGLAITKEIIEKHNGVINLEKSEKGAIFKIVFSNIQN